MATIIHPCRSPLNVVHVGLEMLLTEIQKSDPASPFVSIERSTADFIVHMITSSESAINILNDLLQYEHMEAGIPVHPHREVRFTSNAFDS